MAKNRKANDALWMAILQMLQGGDKNESAAVAAAAMSDIQRDGANKEDIDNVVANTLFAQKNDPVAFIQNILMQHPEMMDELDEYLDDNKIKLHSVEELLPVISSFLTDVRHYGSGGQFETLDKFVDVEINNKVYHLLNCVTESEKERGLSHVSEMDDTEGALFDYSDNPQAELSFWMRGTSIPLLICFVNEVGKIISVHNGIPETDDLITESSEFISYVIEVSSGENINPGDQTSLGKKLDTSELEPGKLYMLNENGEVQAEMVGGNRIFSRNDTKKIIHFVQKCLDSNDDRDFRILGEKIFKFMDIQDNRDPEYVKT